MEEAKRYEISKRIKVVLKNRGMSYAECGEKLGMSKQGVGYWLSLDDEKWGRNEKEMLWWGERLKMEWLKEMIGGGDKE